MCKRYFSRLSLLPVFLLWISPSVLGQVPPFQKGVNFSNWFQASSATQIPFSRFTRQDFADVKSLGADVIRLPINLHAMTQGTPAYTLEPLFLSLLDSAVAWAEAYDLHLILDNHTFDPATNTDPAVEGVLTRTWEQMAMHYRDQYDKLYYEILNEPHGIDESVWGAIQGRVIDAIRAIDTVHTLIVGPANWNSFNSLTALPAYTDPNLIYTFHFYDPFIFTHQGATWVGPSLENLGDIPFPYHPDSMPSLPADLGGTWVANAFNNYSVEGNATHMQNLLDIAIAFQQSRNVPVYCGEFGVYIPNSSPDDRVRWYETFRQQLEAAGIAWTIWDYRGGFGLFEEGTAELFDHHLNIPLVQALGFQSPAQTPYVPQPDTAGFFIYRDFVEAGIIGTAASEGPVSFYGSNFPAIGNRHILWSDADIYNHVAFDFQADKDLNTLLNEDYALDFFIRADGDAQNLSIDVRFLDTKTQDPTDHPWRMRYTLNTGTGDWEHFHLPLSAFSEHGSWDEGMWHNPMGLFDWAAIDRLEFVAEYGGFSGSLYLDHIQLTSQDTAVVGIQAVPIAAPEVRVHRTPFSDQLEVSVATAGNYHLEWMDITGRDILTQPFHQTAQLSLRALSDGIYLLRVHRPGYAPAIFRIRWQAN